MQLHVAAVQRSHDAAQRWQIVDVLQAFARGFQNQRKIALRSGGLQKLGGAQALLPERHALARLGARQIQRPRRAFAESRGEEHRFANLILDVTLQLVRVEQEYLVCGNVGAGLRYAHHDAIIGGIALPVEAVPRLEPVGHNHRPRLMHPPAEGRMQNDAPIALLVFTALDHELLIIGNHIGRGNLFAEQSGQIRAGIIVKPVVMQATCYRLIESCVFAVVRRYQPLRHFTDETAFGHAEADIAPVAFSMPERQPRGTAGSRVDDDAVVGDLLDLPCGGSQGDHVADSRFVDHLLVKLAHPTRPWPRLRFGQHDSIHAAIRNRSARSDG